MGERWVNIGTGQVRSGGSNPGSMTGGQPAVTGIHNSGQYVEQWRREYVPDPVSSGSTSAAVSSYSGSGSVGPAPPPFLTDHQLRMFALGFLVGAVPAYLPFFLKGLGSYSWYPGIVSSEAGITVGALFCVLTLLKERHPFKAAVVLAACFAFVHYVMPFIPWIRLYRSLLR